MATKDLYNSSFDYNKLENVNELPIMHHNVTSYFTQNLNNTQDFFRHSNAVSGLLVSGYVFVFAIGLLGNVFVVSVVVRIRQMRTVTNYFITNLAIADMLVILFCTPATLASNLVTREYNFFTY